MRQGAVRSTIYGCRLLIHLSFLAVVFSLFYLNKEPQEARAQASGPLRILSSNPRYFTDGTGRAVYLTGFHTWSNLVDRGQASPPERFDYERYLDRLARSGHNFIRLWAWELPEYSSAGATIHTSPQPWRRTGPGNAVD